MSYLDFTHADLIALTRQRRREATVRREIEAAHAAPKRGGPHAMLSVKARKDATLYFGGSKSIIQFRDAPTATDRSIRRNRQRVASNRRRAENLGRQNKYARIYALQGGRCYLCGDPFGSQDEATDDHVTPKALGGRRLTNILHACRPCNNAKSHRAPHPCELIYLEAVNIRLPPWDLKRASGKRVELPVFIPLRQRLATQAAE